MDDTLLWIRKACDADARDRSGISRLVSRWTIGEAAMHHASLEKKMEVDGDPNCPYSYKDYLDAKSKGLDLDDWNDYQRYYQLGEGW